MQFLLKILTIFLTLKNIKSILKTFLKSKFIFGFRVSPKFGALATLNISSYLQAL